MDEATLLGFPNSATGVTKKKRYQVTRLLEIMQRRPSADPYNKTQTL